MFQVNIYSLSIVKSFDTFDLLSAHFFPLVINLEGSWFILI